MDKIYMDFYGNHYAAALAISNDDPLARLNNLAISNGVPFGLGEWGFGLSAANALTPDTTPSAKRYVDYFTGVFTGRLNDGHRNGAVMYNALASPNG